MSATSPTVAERVPPHVFFVVSAVFHYLGPSFAVLLFAQLEPSGVAWLRIATAGAVCSRCGGDRGAFSAHCRNATGPSSLRSVSCWLQ